MIYGNAQFLGLPWEAVVKVYREHIGDKRCDALNEYATDFTQFLQSNRNLFPDRAQTALMRQIAAFALVELIKGLRQQLDKSGQDHSLSEGEIEQEFAGLVTARLDKLRDRDEASGLPDDFTRKLRRQYREVIATAKEQVLGDLPYDQGTSQKLTSLVIEHAVRNSPFGDRHGSGIVIAGFGEQEFFPSLQELRIQALVGDRLIAFPGTDIGVSRGETVASVVPFAQRGEVATFMDGIHPHLQARVIRSTVTLLRGVAETILGKVEDHDPDLHEALQDVVEREVDELIRNALHGWNERIQERYSDPVMQIVEALPKDELAALAESLVNLTKFKRRISTDQETVGGPIDVAVITKGDGFVWIERKHYFRAELNPRKIASYGQGA